MDARIPDPLLYPPATKITCSAVGMVVVVVVVFVVVVDDVVATVFVSSVTLAKESCYHINA